LWNSAVWANGRQRTLTGHGERDPDDPTLELAAGEGRVLTIYGDGTAKLEGNRARIYLHASHRNALLSFEANITDPTLENISTKLRSRHNEGGADSNRFGGYGVAFHINSVDFKIEPYHNVHEPGTDHPLARPIPLNQWVGYRVSIQAKANDTVAVVAAYVDYDLSGNWVEVGREEYARTGMRLNDVNALYSWIRANSGDAIQRGLMLRKVRVDELPSLDAP
jgi:hypothetical protein